MGELTHDHACGSADAAAMTTTTPQLVKEQQRTAWAAQARHFYARSELIERQWGPLSMRLLELARVTAGDRVLDLACGVGDPALAAAARVGPTGRVVATDLAPDMVAFAAQRAADAGLTNVEAHEMDAEAIDLPAAGVDAVLCRLGLMFLPDLDPAFAGVYRVLVSGGRFAAAIPWRPHDQLMPRLVDAMLDAVGLPPQAPPEPRSTGDLQPVRRVLRLRRPGAGRPRGDRGPALHADLRLHLAGGVAGLPARAQRSGAAAAGTGSGRPGGPASRGPPGTRRRTGTSASPGTATTRSPPARQFQRTALSVNRFDRKCRSLEELGGSGSRRSGPAPVRLCPRSA
jgi:SAM-dependent methyltransferase